MVPWVAVGMTLMMVAATLVPQNLGSSEGAPAMPSTLEEMVAMVNGTRAYDLDRALENITRSYPAHRSSGSAGANASAEWIFAQMTSMGLDTRFESFSFPSWDLRSRPTLAVAADGDLGENGASIAFSSFNCEQWSSPTRNNGSIGPLVVLPLPAAANREEIGATSIDQSAWNAIDTTGTIVVIGREVRWNANWESSFKNKISAQRPLAIICPYSYDWMEMIDEAQMGSAAGRPFSAQGPYLFNNGIPAGVLNYSEGLALKALANGAARAIVNIDSFFFEGIHRNVVGSLPGTNSSRQVLVTSHYDSVTTNGFCDNGAGVAGMLEIAWVFSAAHRDGLYRDVLPPRQSMVFIAFDSEEIGLVGSLNYVSAHQAELSRIDAVFNLDCIGNRELMVSPTENVESGDIYQLMRQAAADLGVALGEEGPGGSDQESFLHPSGVRASVWNLWAIEVPINGGDSVSNAVMVDSVPIMVTDLWTMNESGWIHTSKDTHTTPGWVTPFHLREQLAVTTLAALRLTTSANPTTSSDLWAALPMIIAVAIMAAVAFYAWRRGK
jgi:hypothetical protein